MWEKTSIFWYAFPCFNTRKPAPGVAFVHFNNKKIFSLSFRLWRWCKIFSIK
jgi:hypothetical protein